MGDREALSWQAARVRELPTGVYEEVLTQELDTALFGLQHASQTIDPAEVAGTLAEHLTVAIGQALRELSPENQVAKANQVLQLLGDKDRVLAGPRQLLTVARRDQPGVWRLLQVRPQVPMSRPALLTNAGSDPKLGEELRAELPTADGVDLLCAFVKWFGLRVLEEQLLGLRSRGVPLRVLTTTYMGATDKTALDRLVRDFGAHVKVNYETRSTRLHAKAWLFGRDSGTDTAYIGSSNFSRAALLDGLEWNVRLAGVHTPELIAKFQATFDGLWEDPSFVSYDPDTDGERLLEALSIASGHTDRTTATFTVSGLEVRPYPHQQKILDDLAVEREVHDRHRNLVVAATGTGKTVIAALDYAPMPGRPTLLFVAHRVEILRQSLQTYREVLADGAFGELWTGASKPVVGTHVFASIQTLSASGVDRLSQYDVVVVDEFHHAEAATYKRLLAHLEPRELLGLTATPERSDGLDVRDFFDGRTAAELRLWDALEADLLCPFHYFGTSDATDLTQLQWSRGDYDTSDLTRVYTADDARVRIVLRELLDKVGDVSRMRALGFCVSVAHAEFMAAAFNTRGVPSLAVSGATPRPERTAALQALRERRVNVLFAVDLFNEGLDVPDVDTLLLLRPTQSPLSSSSSSAEVCDAPPTSRCSLSWTSSDCSARSSGSTSGTAPSQAPLARSGEAARAGLRLPPVRVRAGARPGGARGGAGQRPPAAATEPQGAGSRAAVLRPHRPGHVAARDRTRARRHLPIRLVDGPTASGWVAHTGGRARGGGLAASYQRVCPCRRA